ncbi:cytochrome P450 2E1-like [Oppia nitens]|uniref:cytochrome P450 2E1-like n=1 Tax=Oppia nitens TaxID=1686743 RepID=UPI0023DCBED0|nr:cytochrome P450 2E1-like [Oppia nitens]
MYLWTTILCLLLGFLVYKLSKFYYQYYSLPPGPFPLPIIGNMLTILGDFRDNSFRKMTKKYGPIFTVYFGNTPQVFITDADIARQVFSKPEFAGRPHNYFATLLTNGITTSDYDNSLKAIRRVGLMATVKYSTNERLVNVAVDCVDKTVESMLKREGPDKPIKPADYIYLTFLNILANSSFNENYNIDDKEFIKLKYVFKDIDNEFVVNSFLNEYIKPLKWFDRKVYEKKSKAYNEMRELILKKFKTHYIDYNPDFERDLCDALIDAKNVAVRDGRQSATYLTDDRLAMCVFEMFFGGIKTSEITFQWILLLMAYYPEMQIRLKQEIESKIGNRLPGHQDRQQCPYVMAFIAETLRFRNVSPYALAHKSMVDSKIENYTIPKGMILYAYQGIILRNNLDTKYWTTANVDDFIPDRFIDTTDGTYRTTGFPAFIPFGVGRRQCLGESLAIAQLFLVLVRFIQSTQQYDIVLDSHQGLDADPNNSIVISPKNYTIVLKSKI